MKYESHGRVLGFQAAVLVLLALGVFIGESSADANPGRLSGSEVLTSQAEDAAIEADIDIEDILCQASCYLRYGPAVVEAARNYFDKLNQATNACCSNAGGTIIPGEGPHGTDFCQVPQGQGAKYTACMSGHRTELNVLRMALEFARAQLNACLQGCGSENDAAMAN